MTDSTNFTFTDVPRYTQRPFPTYRYLPFKGIPHPRNDPAGHSYDADEDYLPHFTTDDWVTCEPYLYGVDLFNHGYFWEAHEAWETVWLAAGARETSCGIFVQGLIQLAAAQLKRDIGPPGGAQSLATAACEKLAMTGGIYLGIEVATLTADAQRCLLENQGEFPRIVLHFPA